MNDQPCTCSAYPFPHRKRGGKCQSCRHGIDWRGLDWALNEVGDWCDDCAYEEGWRGEPSECLTAGQRNPGMVAR